MDILNMVFTGLFTVEMLLKLLALRLRVREPERRGSVTPVTCNLVTQQPLLQQFVKGTVQPKNDGELSEREAAPVRSEAILFTLLIEVRICTFSCSFFWSICSFKYVFCDVT